MGLEYEYSYTELFSNVTWNWSHWSAISREFLEDSKQENLFSVSAYNAFQLFDAWSTVIIKIFVSY